MPDKPIKIPEPHKIVMGGSDYSEENGINVIKIKFFENITAKRGREIGKAIVALIDKNN